MLAAMAWWLGAKGGAVWHTRKKRRCRATKAILNLISERPPGRAAPSPPPVGVKETWGGPAFP